MENQRTERGAGREAIHCIPVVDLDKSALSLRICFYTEQKTLSHNSFLSNQKRKDCRSPESPSATEASTDHSTH